MLHRLPFKSGLAHAPRMIHHCQFLQYGLGQDRHAGHLDTAAGTACTGAYEHENHQNRPGKFRPQFKVHRGKSRGRNDRCHLKGHMPERLSQSPEHGKGIDRDQQDGSSYDPQINPRLLAPERIPDIFCINQKIYVKVHAEQNHKHRQNDLNRRVILSRTAV